MVLRIGTMIIDTITGIHIHILCTVEFSFHEQVAFDHVVDRWHLTLDNCETAGVGKGTEST